LILEEAAYCDEGFFYEVNALLVAIHVSKLTLLVLFTDRRADSFHRLC
jgi:hypothetical protein